MLGINIANQADMTVQSIKENKCVNFQGKLF